MTILSRTPDGQPNYCFVCGSVIRVEPSLISRDAPCPKCGVLLWFPPTEFVRVSECKTANQDALVPLDANNLPERLLLNFERISYMSSTMITKLVRLNRAIKDRGGKLVLCNVNVNFGEVFRITKLNRLFVIVDNEDEGYQALR